MTKKFIYPMPGADVEFEAYWNEKSYGATGVKYVKVSSPYSKGATDMVWNDKDGWTKNGGMPYASTVRELFGWE